MLWVCDVVTGDLLLIDRIGFVNHHAARPQGVDDFLREVVSIQEVEHADHIEMTRGKWECGDVGDDPLHMGVPSSGVVEGELLADGERRGVVAGAEEEEQGRGGQLRIGFGSAKNSDCRGITVDELQSINFDRLNFADFYSDLESGTDIPADQELIDRVKNQIANSLQGQGGQG